MVIQSTITQLQCRRQYQRQHRLLVYQLLLPLDVVTPMDLLREYHAHPHTPTYTYTHTYKYTNENNRNALDFTYTQAYTNKHIPNTPGRFTTNRIAPYPSCHPAILQFCHPVILQSCHPLSFPLIFSKSPNYTH